jgi:hypothetical protein
MIQPTVEAVLSGAASYDDLNDTDQAVVRAAWETRDTALIAALDFTVRCPDCGVEYALSSPGCSGHTPRT